MNWDLLTEEDKSIADNLFKNYLLSSIHIPAFVLGAGR